jgi:hypothetical protein
VPDAPKTLNYGVRSNSAILRAAERLVVLLLLGCVVYFASVAWAEGYAHRKYGVLSPGMSRANVDQQLWALRSRPRAGFQALGPGYSEVGYEFLWPTTAMITVVYDANGTVLYAHIHRQQ